MTVTATMRDISIIMVAISSIFVFILLAVLIWQVWRLTKMIQTEIKPILDDTKETMGAVRGTSVFVSENVVTPVTNVSSKIVGARRTLQVLTADLMPQRKSAPQPPTPPSPPTP